MSVSHRWALCLARDRTPSLSKSTPPSCRSRSTLPPRERWCLSCRRTTGPVAPGPCIRAQDMCYPIREIVCSFRVCHGGSAGYFKQGLFRRRLGRNPRGQDARTIGSSFATMHNVVIIHRQPGPCHDLLSSSGVWLSLQKYNLRPVFGKACRGRVDLIVCASPWPLGVSSGSGRRKLVRLPQPDSRRDLSGRLP